MGKHQSALIHTGMTMLARRITCPLMHIVVNGEEQTLNEPCTIQQLLAQRGLSAAPCAVEVNAALVPKRLHAEHWLSDGDRVEVVTLVGGG